MSKPPKNPAMYLAFKNAFEGNKKTSIENEEYVVNRLQKAPFPGRIPVEKIQAAVNSVSKKNES